MSVYLAVLLDAVIGDPRGLPHPILFIGKLIRLFEDLLYRLPNKRLAGCLLVLGVLTCTGLTIRLILAIAALWQPLYYIVSILLLSLALAWKSLKEESAAVITALNRSSLDPARRRLGYIVGRDTEDLDREEIIKATIETTAENTIDGIIAPLFYMMLGFFCGQPVLFAYLYKAINTMDSMVGYKNDRYRQFGWCAARLDDIANLLPARLGAMIMLLAGAILGYDAKGGLKTWWCDRYAHQSPNSAQSESVVAGLLGLQLGGAHYYFGRLVHKPRIGTARKTAEPGDHQKTCRIADISVIIMLVIFGAALIYRSLS